MKFDKIIVLLCSFYFSFVHLKIEKYPGLYIFHFSMLFVQFLPSVNMENIYKDLSQYFCFRPAADSGLEIGCFIVPLVFLSQIVFGEENTFILKDNWLIYHNATILMSLCTILILLALKGARNLATFAIISLILVATVGTTDFQWKGDTNEIFLVGCLLFYIILFLFLLKILPYSFTFGEMMIITQTLVILVVDYSFSIYYRLRFMFPSLYSSSVMVDELPFTRTDTTFIFQTLLVGTLLTGLLLLPVFCYLSFVSDSVDLWIGSLSFYAICLLSTMAIFLPSFYITLGGTNPIVWAYYFLSMSPTRIYLITFWCFVVLLALLTVVWKTHYQGGAENRLPNIITRKIFHILAVVIFVPGIHYDPSLLHLCSSLATALFLLLEFIRIGQIKPFGKILRKYLSPLLDNRDCGRVILTHFYLLVGCSFPLWLYPLDYHKLTNSGCQILLYSGVLSIGLGDSVASIVGVKFGSHYLPGTKKTVEGTAASIFIQLCAVIPLGIKVLDLNASTVIAVIALSSLLEAFTIQIDNFLLPPFTYALFAMTCRT